MKKEMKLIGLTGTIASGKSTAAAYLTARYGLPVLDLDQVNREVLTEEAVKAKLRETFGDGVFAADGSVDRAALAAIVFADEARKKQLTDISWPVIVDKCGDWIRARREAGASACAVEAIDLLKTSLGETADEIWVVFAPPEERVRRMCENRKMTEDEARARMASQWPDEEYLARADRVLYSGGSLARLDRDCRRAYRRLLRK